ncbi:MAG: transglutaminase family protein, partial [Phycisphaerae bacterium]
DRIAELEVSRGARRPRGGAGPSVSPAELRRCLASTIYLKHDDPLVQAMAAEARGSETDPQRLAGRLCRYVSTHVRTKTLDIGFATASEVAQTRQGDCSEHAVLLAALARACGIPSRVVVGIVHVDQMLGRRDVFGYHMWTQMYIDGAWIDLDPTLGQSRCDPTHIAMAVSDLSQSSLSEMALQLLPLIGKLKIEILDVR